VPDWRKSQLPSDDHNGNYLADWVDDQYPEGRADHPVVYVTWAAAQSYCRWAGGRLPTEAEWEYVARAGGDAEFPWGDDMPSPEDANYSASDIGETTPVGSYPPNDFGVHDIAGNVWEFLLDEWREDLSTVGAEGPVEGGPVADSDISSIDDRRSVRGASFGGSVVNLRTRWRDSHVVTNAVEFVGFRCAYPG
jgi:formylglycine-generating enzyme required for sulfatase activity